MVTTRYKRKERQPLSFAFFDGPVYLKPIHSRERWGIESEFTDEKGNVRDWGPLMAAGIAATVVDETGDAVFNRAEAEEMDPEHMRELWEFVSVHLGFRRREAPAKN